MSRADGLIISPTGQGVRNDTAGHGYYHASRGERLHQGIDFLCNPGQRIYCPIDGARFIRMAYPYSDQSYSGVLLSSPQLELFLFYFLPSDTIYNDLLTQGEVIGTAQDITHRYDNSAMQPHVHLELKSTNPALFLNGG